MSSPSAGHVPRSQSPTRPGTTVPPGASAVPTVPAPAEPAEARAAARLIVTRGAVAGTIFPIMRDDTTIGRDDDCDLVINDITVSRYHARIQRYSDRYTVTDNDSLNGVYINRRPAQHAQLAEGDELWIGKARFTFHLPTHDRETHDAADDPQHAPNQRTRTHLTL